ncbi:hypothetical protein [Arthrobacter sp. B3I4]|uniref:hypothetical protein n=1 Tax=Arthrobacter sp. B3I4 TaxID=3042267 RepID=UPI00278B9124|nr:hypothetical protein [Arthrobacter sp. B3I4]MDQ0756109.1 hypothetical protein [Arthrobacter sp. B3I4]
MAEQTPAQKLAEIRKTLTQAKRAEQKAVLELPREEWNRDYQWRKGRTLSGSKTVDVDVDFEIEKEDLEALGYHHEDDCGGSYDDTDVPDHETNRRRLSDWHEHAHGLTLWASCVYEPCNHLTDEFRKTP